MTIVNSVVRIRGRRERALQRRQDELDYWQQVKAKEVEHSEDITEAAVDMKIHRAMGEIKALKERLR
jgi:hypothetical protein